MIKCLKYLKLKEILISSKIIKKINNKKLKKVKKK